MSECHFAEKIILTVDDVWWTFYQIHLLLWVPQKLTLSQGLGVTLSTWELIPGNSSSKINKKRKANWEKNYIKGTLISWLSCGQLGSIPPKTKKHVKLWDMLMLTSSHPQPQTLHTHTHTHTHTSTHGRPLLVISSNAKILGESQGFSIKTWKVSRFWRKKTESFLKAPCSCAFLSPKLFLCILPSNWWESRFRDAIGWLTHGLL